MSDDTTSDLRRALCAAIVGAASDETRPDHPAWVKWLGAELDAMPFERRGDKALIAMGRTILAGPVVDAIVAKRSAVTYESVETYLCPDCKDERLVMSAPDRWSRCLRCNPLPEPDDEGEVTKHRRKVRR